MSIDKKPKNNPVKTIYLIGLKGVGMTMLAQFLAAQGHKVSGSDIKESFMTDKVLRRAKIKVFSPFAAKNIPAQANTIIYSTAYNPKTNPELAFIKNNPARFKNVRLLSYPEALGEIFNQYYGVAVIGSHGKTTITAWLGYILEKAGLNPNVLVGSYVPQFKGSSLIGKSKYFVAEVDEYQNKLKYFNPRGVVLNNIDYDHPDFFKDKKAYDQVFVDFIKKISRDGWLVVNKDDPRAAAVAKFCRGRVIFYSAKDFKKSGVRSGLPGQHNLYNAQAVFTAARQLRVPVVKIKKYLPEFKGTDRRLQIMGRYHGATIIDDYAHHPTEIKASLNAMREKYPRQKIITVFHPHTFSRTKALFKDFARSFAGTDELIILDIYGSAREKQGGVSSRQLADAIVKFNRTNKMSQEVKTIATIPAAAAYLRRRLKAGEVLLLMGAGDVFRVGERLLKV
ncbi:MAG: UDP-N-acetylmuramate--L-alanine ligase [Patescibacteria group bacterium]